MSEQPAKVRDILHEAHMTLKETSEKSGPQNPDFVKGQCLGSIALSLIGIGLALQEINERQAGREVTMTADINLQNLRETLKPFGKLLEDGPRGG